MTQQTKTKKATNHRKAEEKPELFMLEMSIYDRLNITAMMPKTGSIHEAVEHHNIRAAVVLSDKEAKEINLREVSGGLRWNDERAKLKQCAFTESAVKVFLDGCEMLSQQKDFPTDEASLALFQKFEALLE